MNAVFRAAIRPTVQLFSDCTLPYLGS